MCFVKLATKARQLFEDNTTLGVAAYHFSNLNRKAVDSNMKEKGGDILNDNSWTHPWDFYSCCPQYGETARRQASRKREGSPWLRRRGVAFATVLEPSAALPVDGSTSARWQRVARQDVGLLDERAIILVSDCCC